MLGYCVIAFLKLSFLGILRYEIKEMIQKIKLLQTEMACSILGQEAEQQQVFFVFLLIRLVRFYGKKTERQIDYSITLIACVFEHTFLLNIYN